MGCPNESIENQKPEISRVGLGGKGILRSYGREDEARAVILEALARDITYFDTAAAYAGSQGYYGRVWREQTPARDRLFLTGKSADRQAIRAQADLEDSLTTMGLDYLDLWQIHDLRTTADLETVSGPHGALEAFMRAKASGQVRYIGVTGHADPEVLTRAVREWPVDAVLLPVNPVEACLGGFMDQTLPAAREKGMTVIGMKVLGGSYYLNPRAGLTAQALIRFALAQPVDHIVVDCTTPEQVRDLAGAAIEDPPMSLEEQQHLMERFRDRARSLAYYRAPGRPGAEDAS